MAWISAWGSSPALPYALEELGRRGCTIAEPSKQTDVLLLPVPTRISPTEYEDIRKQLREDARIIGGGIGDVDLLQDAFYQAGNAAITAHCALQTAMEHTDFILDGARILILGWGRIGKCLAQLLRALGAEVTVYARKASDRAMLKALGYAVSREPRADADVVFNTIPRQIGADAGNALGIELASGEFLQGTHVICARGLPGKLAPKSSGRLIAQAVEFLLSRKEEIK